MCNHCRENEINPEFEHLFHTETEYELLPELEASLFDFETGNYITAGSEATIIRSAITRGERNENTLTDLLFYTRHPELNRKPLAASMPNFTSLSAEWIRIRDTMVRPALQAPAGTSPSAPYTPAPSGGTGKLNWQSIYNAMRRKGYVIYEQPYRLNIVGVRSANNVPDRFDDSIHVLFKDNSGKWIHYNMPATTDPGKHWLNNPMRVEGTAIVKPGQYIDSHQIGLHKGEYKALTQLGNVTVIRDANRDNILDFNAGREGPGYGINIHRASASRTSTVVDKYSAGCQVIANPADFNRLLELAEQHRSRYGNKYTYTLLVEKDLK
jgi:hypothetical protein